MTEQNKHSPMVQQTPSLRKRVCQSLLIWMLITTSLLFLIHLLGNINMLPPVQLLTPSLLTIILCACGAFLTPIVHKFLDVIGEKALLNGAIPMARFIYWSLRGSPEVPAYYHLGECELADGTIRNSIKAFQLAIKHDRIGHYGLGTAYLEKGEPEKAIKHLHLALYETHRNIPLDSIFFSMALAYAENKNYDRARNAIYSYTEHGGEPFLAHVLLGQIYDEEQNSSQAVSHYKIAMELAKESQGEDEILLTVQERLKDLTDGAK